MSEQDAIDMTQNAIKEQELDAFNSLGWTKLVAPAKVNLFLGIGARRDDGYHDALSILHTLNIHDTLYMRREMAAPGTGLDIKIICTGTKDIKVPTLEPQENIAYRAVSALAKRVGRSEDEVVYVRIEKNIPFQAGLGGGSADAAAALVGAAHLWGIDANSAEVEEVARGLGADVPFFLRGGCGCYEGTGDDFSQALQTTKKTLVLVKPEDGMSTAAAYRAFDQNPHMLSEDILQTARQATTAEDVRLTNNLAPAAESLLPVLAEVRTWLLQQPGVSDVLLCGSGSCTFAVCDTFEDALAVVGAARLRGWWSRTTAFGPLRAAVVPQKDR